MSNLLTELNKFQVDTKGNLIPVKFHLNHDFFQLKVERLDPLTPSPTSPLSPLSPSGKKRRSLTSRFSWQIRERKSFGLTPPGNANGGSSLKSDILIELCHIKDLRTSPFDHKVVNSQALKKLKNNLLYGRRHGSQSKLLVLLYGNEFNLKKLTFLVVEPASEAGEPLTQQSQRCQKRRQSEGVLELWISELQGLISKCIGLSYFEQLELWLQKEYHRTNSISTDNHRLKIWRQFLTRHRVNVSIHALGTWYSDIETSIESYRSQHGTGSLGKAEFELTARRFLHSPQSISTIFEIFSLTSDQSNVFRMLEESDEAQIQKHEFIPAYMDILERFLNYLTNYGKCLPDMISELDVATPYTKAVIRKLVACIQGSEQNSLVNEHWLSSHFILDYLFSEDNSIWDPKCDEVSESEMNRPFSHYWIATSHNTYLTGDQYSSQSSAEAYARALRQGCRCIEIDVWDGRWNKPVVRHGFSLTSSVNLKDVLIAIKENAFVTSHYPVIISIENHCSIRQQKTMVKYFRRIFGPMLLTTRVDCNNASDGVTGCQANSLPQVTQLPSPNQLKNRILLKGRTLPLQMFEQETSSEQDPGTLSEIDTIDQHSFLQSRRSTFRGSETYHPDEDLNSCDCLSTGELWRSNDKGEWIECVFMLTKKRLFYIEKQNQEDIAIDGKLPYFIRRMDNEYRSSMNSASSVESNQDLHTDQVWYYGKMAGGRVAATAILEQCNINGAFLVRQSDTQINGFTLSFTGNNKVYHCHIHTKLTNENERMYSLKLDPKEGEIFSSIFELIEYYKGNSLVTSDCELDRLMQAVPPSSTHEMEEWFYKDMDRAGAERVLEKLPINGAFLGRYSSKNRDEIVISFRFDNIIKHCSIQWEGRYLLTVGRMKFSKLEQLVDHYSRYPFYKDIKLGTPVGDDLYRQSQQSDCIQRVYAAPEYLNSTVKTVKGRVRAIQSYTTEDPELLSFKKGEVIVNVVKEADGWWWGTRQDSPEGSPPKLFCSSFVEEIEELECPFGDHLCKGHINLGLGAKVKMCKDKTLNEQGIKYYLSFKDHDKKWKLGAGCSKRKVNEWADLINYVVDKDPEGKRALAKIQAGARANIAPELSDLIVYFCAIDLLCPSEIDLDKRKIVVTGIKSFDEVTGNRVFCANPQFWVWYHQYAMTRVYPEGLRHLDSSNFNPARYWNCGSQMCALNYQTPDKAMQWNRGKFRQNGNCGYVLKPDFMISETQDKSKLQFDPSSSGESSWEEMVLSIQIISARHLDKPGSGAISPLVEIEVIGVDADCNKVKTLPADNGLNPCWNHQLDVRIRCPELALIQFSVCDMNMFSDRVLLGESTIPVNCIRTGYRSMRLNNAHGEPLFSTLLFKVERNT